MITTPMSLTYEYLNSLKFKEIQKLSVQFHVNKRWAKKQELIDNLLALKEKDDIARDNKQENENEWRDGSTIFNDLNSDHDENRRLTFNITSKGNVNAKGLHKEFQHQEVNKLSCQQVNPRETYDIPPKEINFNAELLTESRATFDIPPKEQLIDKDSTTGIIASRNGKKLLKKSRPVTSKDTLNKKNINDENSVNSDLKITDLDHKNKVKSKKFDLNLKDEELIEKNKTVSKGTVLTIPYTRVIRRTTKKDTEVPESDNSPIRISQKSINIKKPTRLPMRKKDLINSPVFSSVKKSINKQSITDPLKPQSGRILRSKVQIRLEFAEEMPKSYIGKKSKDSLPGTLPKTADQILEKKLNSVGDDYKNQPTSAIKNLKATPLNKFVLKNTNERSILGRSGSNIAQTPGNKAVLGIKPVTASKMPDFNKIHKKQFEQMDSLHDYIRKKEERIKKLFGAPQPGQQLQVCNKSTPIFQFQSQVSDKEGTGKENLHSLTTPFKRKERDTKNVQKEARKGRKLASKFQTDLKDKNRSLIQGVRTNKRFELLMKHRNI